MENHEEHSAYYEDALKIHAICADLKLSEYDARLLTYIHTKSVESGQGIDYFDNPPEQDCEALEIMLGRSKGALRLPSVISMDEEGQEAIDLILNISSKINQLDNLLARELGMENRLSGELKARLRLYKDSLFLSKMIKLYNTMIVPIMPLYNKNKIDTAFSRYREEQSRIEKELMEMTGLGNG